VKLTSILSMAAVTFFVATAEAKDYINNPVWVWKMSGGQRDVYLIGELHYFSSDFGLKIDYQLGEKIAQLSSEIWIESQQDSVDILENPPNLSAVLTEGTWNSIQKITQDSIQKITSTSDESRRADHVKNFINALNISHPVQAYGSIVSLHNLTYRSDYPLARLPYNGLKRHLMKNRNKDAWSFKDIEDKQSVSRTWRKNCDSKATEALLSSALNSIHSNSFLEDVVQKVFLDQQSDPKQLEEAIASRVEGRILNRCSVYPRNVDWFPKMKQAIETRGKPVVFLFGIGHFLGDQGLINMLRLEGYTDIKRIYTLE
jgi:uncharacterized protein YbaP (TraB family)